MPPLHIISKLTRSIKIWAALEGFLRGARDWLTESCCRGKAPPSLGLWAYKAGLKPGRSCRQHCHMRAARTQKNLRTTARDLRQDPALSFPTWCASLRSLQAKTSCYVRCKASAGTPGRWPQNQIDFAATWSSSPKKGSGRRGHHFFRTKTVTHEDRCHHSCSRC